MKVSVIIPVYNERRTFHQVLDRVWRAPLPAGCTKEVVVVDDGSTDGTTRLLAERQKAGLVVGHHSERNLGKGAAIRTAITIATGDILIIQDGDLEYDPEDYAAILEPIVSGRADVVYGSRFLKSRRPMTGKYWLANRALTIVANLLYRGRLSDEATAYKAFRGSILRSLKLNCRRFEFCPEVTAKLRRLGYAIHEVPINYNPRGIIEGKKIRLVDGLEAFWALVRYRFVPLRSFVREEAPRVTARPAADPATTPLAARSKTAAG
jgi:dolichol-phosphate mannosyltransferase